MIKRNLFILLVLLMACSALGAQDLFEKHVFVSASGDSLNYRLLRPEGEERGGERGGKKSAKRGPKYPLVLFLHGAGERGTDNEKQLINGGQMWLNPVNRASYPAFVLAPQCPETLYWAYAQRPASFLPHQMPAEEPITPLLLAVKELLDTCLALPQVDKSRVYIMGLSMGGMATFDMAVRFPELFAAAVPICGTVNDARLKAAKNVAFRIFHGDADNVVTVEGSRQAYKALKTAGAEVQYVEYPSVNHGSWVPAFNDPEFMSWLFGRKKK